MKCPYCMEDIADGASKCKHCKSLLNTNTAPGKDVAKDKINSLNMSDKLKRRFLRMTKDDGSISGLFNIWAFFGGFIYYMVVGMWKKSLMLLALPFVILFALILLDVPDVYVDSFTKTGLLWWLYAGFYANRDLYRFRVNGENFWW